MPRPGPPLTVYWRPGCGFCSTLTARLDELDVHYERVNIWEDDKGAAFVRSVARGYETVPTVTLGKTALVNPSAEDILAALGSHEEPS